MVEKESMEDLKSRIHEAIAVFFKQLPALNESSMRLQGSSLEIRVEFATPTKKDWQRPKKPPPSRILRNRKRLEMFLQRSEAKMLVSDELPVEKSESNNSGPQGSEHEFSEKGEMEKSMCEETAHNIKINPPPPPSPRHSTVQNQQDQKNNTMDSTDTSEDSDDTDNESDTDAAARTAKLEEMNAGCERILQTLEETMKYLNERFEKETLILGQPREKQMHREEDNNIYPPTEEVKNSGNDTSDNKAPRDATDKEEDNNIYPPTEEVKKSGKDISDNKAPRDVTDGFKVVRAKRRKKGNKKGEQKDSCKAS